MPTDDALRSPATRVWAAAVGWAALAATVPAAVVTVLAAAASWHWSLDLMAHWPMPCLLVLAPGAVVLLLLRRWRTGALVAVAAAIAAARLLPLWTGAAPTGEGATRPLRLVVANLCFVNPEPERLRPFVEATDPDVVALSEITDEHLPRLEWLRQGWPHTLVDTNEDCYGVAIFSRLPLRDASIIALGPPRAPAIRAVVETAAGDLGLINLHPVRPGDGERGAQRDAALRDLPAVVRDLPRPFVVVGDANATRWSEPFKSVLAECGLRDSSEGFGYQGTWPAAAPWFLRIPIDHVLTGPGVTTVRRELGPDFGSDHLPVFAELRLSLPGSPR